MIERAKFRELPGIIRMNLPHHLKWLHCLAILSHYICRTLFVCSINNKPAGYLTLEFNHIDRLFVSTEYRNKGVGKNLLQYAEAIILKKGYKQIKAFCTLGVLNYYLKQGWQMRRLIFIKKALRKNK